MRTLVLFLIALAILPYALMGVGVALVALLTLMGR